MAARSVKEIEKQVEELQKNKSKNDFNNVSLDKVGMNETGIYDQNIYGSNDKYSGYVDSIPIDDHEENDPENLSESKSSNFTKFTAPKNLLETDINEDYDPMAGHRRKTIADRESEYQARRRNQLISPAREDPFVDGGKTPKVTDLKARSFSDIMTEQNQKKEEVRLVHNIQEKIKSGELKVTSSKKKRQSEETEEKRSDKVQKVEQPDTDNYKSKVVSDTPKFTSATPFLNQWDATPSYSNDSSHEKTPSIRKIIIFVFQCILLMFSCKIDSKWNKEDVIKTPGSNSWAETPRIDNLDIEMTPSHSSDTPSITKQSRWNKMASETPLSSVQFTPSTSSSVTPSKTPIMTPSSTPSGTAARAMATPSVTDAPSMTPEQVQAWRWEKEIDERNRPWMDEDLNALFPFDGYKILQPPTNYQPIKTPARKLTATPTPSSLTSGYKIPSDAQYVKVPNLQPEDELPPLKLEDMQYFDKLLNEVDEDSLPPEEQKERRIMKFLLKIKNGTPPMRKSSMRQITEKAREYGAGPLFNQILPLLMSPTLEDQERHLLVKLIDRILYKLDDLVRPYVHKILVVIEPLLIDEDYYARIEGREIISNLSKAAGLATMISTMRPDIDNVDEYVRNTTSRAFAVVASALGIPSLLPFLKAVCKSKKSWQARHTGIKIVQQIALLMGCAILPHLKSLVEIIEIGLTDEQQKVRTITALAISALAEASAPYGIESFDSVLKPLWKGIRQHRGKGLAAFLKAIGCLIPLMDAEYAFHYTKEVVIILIREFTSPDDEMKKIVLKVVQQCVATDGVEAAYIKSDILGEFFRHFWNQRMALDKRNYKQLVETTVEIANKVGAYEIIIRIVDDLKDENEHYRKMVIETLDKILANLGAADIDLKLEEQLIDGILYAFQEQTTEDNVMLDGFGTVIKSFGIRAKPYLPQICGTVLWRLNNKSAKVRQQAADLITRIAPVMKLCNEEKLMGHLGVVLYEYLGEEYPDVLGSILGGLKAIVNVIGMNKMTPPIKDLLPRLTPILKNRHEKVQENCIDLVGRIADRGSEHVSAREWMRICFELLELLKAHKKSIRRAACNTFGYIAKAIGPQDVLSTLLSNLKVQERQLRVCTTVAIAIVAETCSPFTVIPALMNEYRVPEVNVQNGVLKSFAFMFEYIGEMGKDYIYAVTPLLEDALMDRDLVHRQIASAAVKHVAIGVFGFGYEDAVVHLMNYVWPNIFEESPHIVNTVTEAIEGFRVTAGPCRVLQYTLQGLFHPARKIRDVYWRIYNGLYIASQESLVAFYPSLDRQAHSLYNRTELDYFL